MSNGDEYIVFRDPETFAETRRIRVHQNAASGQDSTSVTRINELEVVGDRICKEAMV